MPFTLETWSVFSTQKQVWMCALHPKNICLHFFFILGTRCGLFIIYFFFLIQQIFTVYFLHKSDRYLLQWTKHYTSQFMTNSKTQKDEGKKERTSVSLLHSSKLTRPVACANSRIGHEDSFYFDVEINMNLASLHWVLLGVMSCTGIWKAVQKQKLFPRELKSKRKDNNMYMNN